MRAFVLHSGGIDSTTCLMLAIKEHGAQNVQAVSIDYGQRHLREISASMQICECVGVLHATLQLGLQPVSMLTNPEAAIPNVSYRDIVGVSPTYVPFRNGQLLSRLAAHASAIVKDTGVHAEIFFGAHAEDAAGGAYPDCTIEFVKAMDDAIRIGTYGMVSVRAPLISMMKDEIIRLGAPLNAPYDLSWSCYRGGKMHCGVCPTCRARREGFSKAGVKDPTAYESEAA